MTARDPTLPLEALLEYARSSCGARAASYFDYEEPQDSLVLRASTHDRGTRPKATRFSSGSGLVGRAASTGVPVFSRDARCDPNFSCPPGPPPNTASLLALPLREGGGVRGVLNLTWQEPREPLAHEQVEHLEQAASDLLRREDHRGFLPPGQFLGPARDLQRHQLPESNALLGHRVERVFRPLDVVGGDLVAIWPHRARPLLALADASGHDTGAAMTAAMTRALLGRAARAGESLEAMLADLDTCLREELPVGWFVTCFLTELDPGRDRLRYHGGGHPAALLDLPGEEAPRALRSLTGAPGLGHEPAPAGEAPWPRGARLLIFSDGMEGPYGGLAAEAALSQLMVDHRDQSIEQLRQTLVGELAATPAIRRDDVALLLVERK